MEAFAVGMTRVLVIETPLSRAEVMKNTRAAKVMFKKQKRVKVLKSYKLVEAGDRCLLITKFANKASMNKFVKATAGIRLENIDETGSQSCFYFGTDKASG